MKNNDLYQQCYYYGKLRTGLRVQRSSDNDIKISDKYSLKGKEFEDSKIQGIITEFSEYSSYSNSFIYVGAKSIDLRDNNGRYDQINHIFLHDEQDDLTDPRSYIRYILPYYYKGEYEPDNDLKNIDIPAINMSCREILDKYNLNGDKNLKKLAKLVMLFYNKLFNSNSLIIALDDNKFCYDDENYNCYRQASEIMLFLHIIVPGCFLSYNTKENLRKKLKYCIVEKVKSNSVCFMPKSCCSGENVFDFDNAYNDIEEEDFYYQLAKRIQQDVTKESAYEQDKMECMQKFLLNNCPDGKKIDARQENLRHVAIRTLIRNYEALAKARRFEDSQKLIKWNESGIDKIISSRKNDDINLCKSYLKHLLLFKNDGSVQQIPGEKELLLLWEKYVSENDITQDEQDEMLFLISSPFASDQVRLKMIKDVINNHELLLRYYNTEGNYILQKIDSAGSSFANMKSFCDLFGSVMKSECELSGKLKWSLAPKAEELIKNINDFSEQKVIYELIIDFNITKKETIDNILMKKIFSSDAFKSFECFTQNIAHNQTSVYSNVMMNIFFEAFLRKSECNRVYDETNIDECENINKKCIDNCFKILNQTDIGDYQKKRLDDANEFYNKILIGKSKSFTELQSLYGEDFPELNSSLKKYFFDIAAKFAENVSDFNEYRKMLVFKKKFDSEDKDNAFYKNIDRISGKIAEEVMGGNYSRLFWVKFNDDPDVFKCLWELCDVKSFPVIFASCSEESIKKLAFIDGKKLKDSELWWLNYSLFLVYCVFIDQDISSKNADLYASVYSFINKHKFKWESEIEYTTVYEFLCLNDVYEKVIDESIVDYFNLAENVSDRYMIHRVLYTKFGEPINTDLFPNNIVRKINYYRVFRDFLDNTESLETNIEKLKDIINAAYNKEIYFVNDDERVQLTNKLKSIACYYKDNNKDPGNYFEILAGFPVVSEWALDQFKDIYGCLPTLTQKYAFYKNISEKCKDLKVLNDIVNDNIEKNKDRNYLLTIITSIRQVIKREDFIQDKYGFVLVYAILNNIIADMISVFKEYPIALFENKPYSEKKQIFNRIDSNKLIFDRLNSLCSERNISLEKDNKKRKKNFEDQLRISADYYLYVLVFYDEDKKTYIFDWDAFDKLYSYSVEKNSCYTNLTQNLYYHFFKGYSYIIKNRVDKFYLKDFSKYLHSNIQLTQNEYVCEIICLYIERLLEIISDSDDNKSKLKKLGQLCYWLSGVNDDYNDYCYKVFYVHCSKDNTLREMINEYNNKNDSNEPIEPGEKFLNRCSKCFRIFDQMKKSKHDDMYYNCRFYADCYDSDFVSQEYKDFIKSVFDDYASSLKPLKDDFIKAYGKIKEIYQNNVERLSAEEKQNSRVQENNAVSYSDLVTVMSDNIKYSDALQNQQVITVSPTPYNRQPSQSTEQLEKLCKIDEPKFGYERFKRWFEISTPENIDKFRFYYFKYPIAKDYYFDVDLVRGLPEEPDINIKELWTEWLNLYNELPEALCDFLADEKLISVARQAQFKYHRKGY